MRAKNTVQLRVELPSTLYKALTDAATRANTSAETLAADCIAQALETALRHQVLIERQEQIDQALLAIAEFVGAVGGATSDLAPPRPCVGDEP